MNDRIDRQLLYREAFDLLSRINELLIAARAKHEQKMSQRKSL